MLVVLRLAEQLLAKFLLWEFNPTLCAVPDKERKNPLSCIPTLIAKIKKPQPSGQKEDAFLGLVNWEQLYPQIAKM